MKGILRVNAHGPSGKHYNTTDYVKICKPMRLEEYSIGLFRHRDYPEIWPFKGWSAASGAPGRGATASLPWYDAYNKTKHDREANFEAATLSHALTAVAAVHALLFAQYGSTFSRQLARNSFFLLREYPKWHHRDRVYPPLPNDPWVRLAFPF